MKKGETMKIASVVYPHCQKVLPLVYDDSLSYYESICKLVNKINEVIEQFDDWSDVIAELQEAIKDIDGMKSDINELQSGLTSVRSDVQSLSEVITSIDDYVKALEKRYDARFKEDEQSISALAQIIGKMQTNIDAKIEALREELIALFNSFTFEFKEELEMLQLKFNQLKVNVLAQLDELRRIVDEIDTKVVNPWHSNLRKVSQQRNVNLMYQDLADNVPTASEYCQESLTAQEYTDLGLTALEYAEHGRRKLHISWVFSPSFGWRQEISNVLTSILDFVYDVYTATAYSELDLTADEYTELSYSADDYYLANYHGGGGGGDTRGCVKFDPSNTGLTRREYEHLGVSQT